MLSCGSWGLAGLFITTISLRRNLRARQQAATERERLICKLQDALANVKELRGLIPICSSCKKIHNDQGYWTHLETYLQQHTAAEFSHGLCVDCLRKLYPDLSGEVEARFAKQTPSTVSNPKDAIP
jgi:ABC-type transport system involved in cytochrome bd biosynthesis fused ATPase/permease subunit